MCHIIQDETLNHFKSATERMAKEISVALHANNARGTVGIWNVPFILVN